MMTYVGEEHQDPLSQFCKKLGVHFNSFFAAEMRMGMHHNAHNNTPRTPAHARISMNDL